MIFSKWAKTFKDTCMIIQLCCQLTCLLAGLASVLLMVNILELFA